MSEWRVINAECVAMMQTMEPESVDAIVCDPPYDLVGQKTSRSGSLSTGNMKSPAGRHGPSQARGFMGMHWDGTGVAFKVETWQAALRVAKPGAHLIAFGGTRTYHRMVVAIEDAGWEIRDCIVWHYATGFPKSRDISKDMDAMAGVEREVIGEWRPTGTARIKGNGNSGHDYTHGELRESLPITTAASDEAKEWQGWGTALKPATELIVLARKPISESTVAANVLKHGTGAINIDGCRIPAFGRSHIVSRAEVSKNVFGNGLNGSRSEGLSDKGRWPANVTLDEEAAEELDDQSGYSETARIEKPSDCGGQTWGTFQTHRGARGHTDSGGASRFFFVAKASTSERDEGLSNLPASVKRNPMRSANGTGEKNFVGGFPDIEARNIHPTTKPITLMRYLTRLVTPPNGTVLDPFCGSGTTGCACMLEDFNFIGIEQDTEHGYVQIAEARIAHYAAKPKQGSLL